MGEMLLSLSRRMVESLELQVAAGDSLHAEQVFMERLMRDQYYHAPSDIRYIYSYCTATPETGFRTYLVQAAGTAAIWGGWLSSNGN